LSQWRFHHRPVNALPSPRDSFKVIVFGQTGLPQGFKDSGLLPLKESGMDRTGAAETLGGECFPLAARSQNVYDAFKDKPRVFGLAPTTSFARIGLIRQALAYRDQRLYAPPKLIGDFP
jgi:hypothetical protein